jgi:hypothetical protein
MSRPIGFYRDEKKRVRPITKRKFKPRLKLKQRSPFSITTLSREEKEDYDNLANDAARDIYIYLRTKRNLTHEEALNQLEEYAQWGEIPGISSPLGKGEPVDKGIKASIQSTNEKIKWNIPWKLRPGEKIVYMTPIEFLSKVPEPIPTRDPPRTAADVVTRDESWNKRSIQKISNNIRRGTEIDMPYLDYERPFRGFPSHEGRHRAYVAYKMGIREIPVIVTGEE